MHTIAIGCDPNAARLKDELIAHLLRQGYPVTDMGSDDVIYPNTAARVARAVAAGEYDRGILLCGTGLGIGLAANKIKGIRCVTCSDPLSAELGRRHNNANMLSMGARIIGPELAKCIARAFLTAQFEGGRHALRVEMLSALERGEEIE